MPSGPEIKLDAALRELYPADRISDYLPIKVRGRTLFVDRIIKSKRLAFEIDGRQHREFVLFMHGDADGFKSHQERDAAKTQWLRANGYTLVRLRDDEPLSAEILRAKILEALNESN